MNRWKIDMVTMDELALLSEEEIADRIGKCRSEIGKRQGDLEWRMKWETEMAYAQRELQIRHTRRRRHQDYLQAEADWAARFADEEVGLPEYEGNRIPRYVRELFEWN